MFPTRTCSSVIDKYHFICSASPCYADVCLSGILNVGNDDRFIIGAFTALKCLNDKVIETQRL